MTMKVIEASSDTPSVTVMNTPGWSRWMLAPSAPDTTNPSTPATSVRRVPTGSPSNRRVAHASPSVSTSAVIAVATHSTAGFRSGSLALTRRTSARRARDGTRAGRGSTARYRRRACQWAPEIYATCR